MTAALLILGAWGVLIAFWGWLLHDSELAHGDQFDFQHHEPLLARLLDDENRSSPKETAPVDPRPLIPRGWKGGDAPSRRHSSSGGGSVAPLRRGRVSDLEKS